MEARKLPRDVIDLDGETLKEHIAHVRSKLAPLHVAFLDQHADIVYLNAELKIPATDEQIAALCGPDGRLPWTWGCMDYQFAWLEWGVAWADPQHADKVGTSYAAGPDRSVRRAVMSAGAPAVRSTKKEANKPGAPGDMCRFVHFNEAMRFAFSWSDKEAAPPPSPPQTAKPVAKTSKASTQTFVVGHRKAARDKAPAALEPPSAHEVPETIAGVIAEHRRRSSKLREEASKLFAQASHLDATAQVLEDFYTSGKAALDAS